MAPLPVILVVDEPDDVRRSHRDMIDALLRVSGTTVGVVMADESPAPLDVSTLKVRLLDELRPVDVLPSAPSMTVARASVATIPAPIESVDPEFAAGVRWWISKSTGKSGSPDTILPWKTEPIVKLGRNDPCPCGSGRKVKKCCPARLER